MKTKHTILYKKYWFAGIIGLSMLCTSCEKQELTTGMPENQLITSLELHVDQELPLLMGLDSTISYQILPENADFKDLLWRSSNELIASVAQDGTITARSLGKSTISVCPIVGFGTENTMKTITVTVIPEVIPAEEIVFTNTVNTLYENDMLQLTYNILPANHTYSYLTWSSSDESIATVDKNGLVTGVKAGEVTIYAQTHDKSNTKGEFKLTVKKSEPATDITIIPVETPLYWKQTLALSYTMTPEEATAATITWESSDTNVLTVDKGVVKAVGFGTATVTATCVSNGKKDAITLTVHPGFYVWDASTEFEGWTINGGLGSIERKDGILEATVTTDANKRVYLQRVYSTVQNLLDMNFKDYPVVAIKTSEIPAGCNFALNMANLEKTLNLNGAMKNIKLDDGSQVWYYDASQFANLTNKDGVVPVRAFIFKITKVNIPSFTIDWIRTFPSMDELNSFVKP